MDVEWIWESCFFDLSDESERVPEWNGKVPVKDSMSNKSGRIYKDDQEVGSLLIISTKCEKLGALRPVDTY